MHGLCVAHSIIAYVIMALNLLPLAIMVMASAMANYQYIARCHPCSIYCAQRGIDGEGRSIHSTLVLHLPSIIALHQKLDTALVLYLGLD